MIIELSRKPEITLMGYMAYMGDRGISKVVSADKLDGIIKDAKIKKADHSVVIHPRFKETFIRTLTVTTENEKEITLLGNIIRAMNNPELLKKLQDALGENIPF